MTEREVAEIRRRFRQDKSNITRIRGCYVNDKRDIVSQFDQSMAMLSQEEGEKFLAILKRTLSGGLGRNLIDITFSTQQVASGEEHQLLMALRGSSLREETAVQAFFQKVISSVSIEGGYLILLTYDAYDVPYRAKDDVMQKDASAEVYTYILCSICPIKMTKPALGYRVHENEFHNCKQDWIVSPPELGFLFPAFDDRSANLYQALYYTRDTTVNHTDFVDAVFKQELPLPATVQKAAFDTVLSEVLAEDCSMDLVQAVQEQLCEMIEEQKADRAAPPLLLGKREMARVLQDCGASDDHAEAFQKQYDAVFGETTELPPRNLVDAKKLEIALPDVSIRVNPERSDLVQTRVLGGVNYIMIRADEGVELNGVSIQIAAAENE